ncbi:MAG TPA: PDZ domain-containing protein [Blastocatellia bacterium]|nr:PDZ domain-containing protein [Blastocatellia bacterium]
MLRRFYLITSLATALAVGLVVAHGETAQKDKQKEKEKTEEKEKDKEKPFFVYGDGPRVFAINSMFGEGSYLGVFLEDVTPERMKELGLSEERGAVIMKVVKGSPAERAGLKENDVVVSYNGRRIDSVREFQRLLSETPAGRNVTIEVIRGGSHQTVAATLSKNTPSTTWIRPEFNDEFWKKNEEALKRAEEARKLSEEKMKELQEKWKKNPPDFGSFAFDAPGRYMFFSGKRMGIGVESLTPQLAEFFGVKDGKGVLVTEVEENSPAAKAGVKAGDVITAIDNEPVDSVRSLMSAMSKKQEGTVTLSVLRNRAEQTFTLTIEKREVPRAPRARLSARAGAFI